MNPNETHMKTQSARVSRRRAVSMLAALLWFSFSKPTLAADDDDDYELLYTTPDKWLQVWSDHKITDDRCKAISDRVRKAYMFNNKQEAWSNQELLFKAPLRIRVLSEIRNGVLGFARGPNLFVVQDDYLDNELSEGTLAHELTHIQDNRQLCGGKLPSFMLEGRALTNGHSYRVSIGQKDNQYDTKMATSAVQFTSANAEEILSKTQDVGWDMQAMGTFLVEYMRTRWKGGVADIHPKLSQMIGKIAGGADFETAFAKQFGTPFKDLVKEFMEYLDKTSKTPEVRLEKTMWQNLAASGDDDDDE